jgi:hypothetical protein
VFFAADEVVLAGLPGDEALQAIFLRRTASEYCDKAALQPVNSPEASRKTSPLGRQEAFRAV